MKKKFQEYVVKREAIEPLGNAAAPSAPAEPQPVAPSGGGYDPRRPFDNVGMGKKDIGRTMRGLRNMLTSKGVADGPEEKKAMRRMVSILRGSVMRLMSMGLGADDLLMLFQGIMSAVVTKGSSQTGFNSGRVGRAINTSVKDEE